MNKIVNFLHKYLVIISVLIGVSILLGLSYSSFFVSSDNHKAAEMYIGELKYSMTIDNEAKNTLTVPSGETIIDLTVNSLDPVDTYYKLLYLKNSNIEIKYYESTKDTDEIVTTYSKPNDSIVANNSNNIKLLIINNSETDQTIELVLKGGYITNTLSDISLPTNYSEITVAETLTSNTYFCKTTDTLTQGLKYINGQYTYAYKQHSNISSWSNDDTDGWGILLTDKTSTDPVTSKVCTYINNKPITIATNTYYQSQATAINLNDFNTKNITNMNSMFAYSQATTLDASSFDTSNVTNMYGMFYNSQATTIDISNFNTSKVTDMHRMFSDTQATTLDVSSFDTSNVTKMGSMFAKSQATILNLKNFDTSKVTNMSWMFDGSQATTIDVSSFNTSNVTNMSIMFRESKVTMLDVSNFDTSKVTSMYEMFFNVPSSVLDVSSFDTSNVTNMYRMFYKTKATTLDVSNFDTSKVINMAEMFDGSKSTILDVSKFNTSNVTSMRSMFLGSSATTLDVSNFDTSKVTDMYGMFYGTKATTLDVSNFNTSNVTNMGSMFYQSKATTLDVSNFDTSNVTNMSWMFYQSKATTLDVGNFNTSNVTNMSYMFGSIQATELDISSFNTSNVTNMGSMFYNNSKLKTIYVSDKFNTDNVTSSNEMFRGSNYLVGGSGTKYDSSHVDKEYARIDGGTSSPGYFTDVADKGIPAPNSFSTDSWKTIINAVRKNNISKYSLGDTKTIDMGTYGTHTIRISNTTTPSECSTTGFSQTACGFVLEFADPITTHNINDTSSNTGGWPATSMRTFLNNDIYNSLPTDLKSGISETTVVSGHESSVTSNYTSTDKIYLLSTAELWLQGTSTLVNSDSARDVTRQLDYYSGIKTNTDTTKAIKKFSDGTYSNWWLRTAFSSDAFEFYYVGIGGGWNGKFANEVLAVAPAFRIG